MIDLSPQELAVVQSILHKFLRCGRAWAFGSRVNGKGRKHSDLDIAIDAGNPLEFSVLSRIKDAFEESDLSFKVDLVDFHSMSEKFKKISARRKYPLCEIG